MKRINHALRYRDVCRWLVLALALGGLQVAHAQSTDRVSAAEFGRLWGPALDPTGATQVRNFPMGPAYPVTSTPSITAESGGGLAVTKSARFPVDSSRVIDVVAKAPISKSAMAKGFAAAASLAGGPTGIALFATVAMLDWMTSAGVTRNSDGTFTGPTPSLADGSYDVAGAFPSLAAVIPACQSSYPGATCGVRGFQVDPGVNAYCGISKTGPGYCVEVRAVAGRTNPKPGSYVYTATWTGNASLPIGSQGLTLDQLIAPMSVPTMKPEYLTELLKSGASVDAGNSSLTGPSSVAGPSSSSTKQLKDSAGNVTGTQTVNQATTYNITYNGNTYNVNSVTTTTTVNPDGTSTVQTETAAKPTEKDPATDCDKFPSSLGCSDLDVPEGTIPKTTRNIAYTAETWFGGGSCPADKYLTTHGQQIKVWDWQSTCSNLVTYFRPVLLICAAVMAMFIVLPKGAEA